MPFLTRAALRLTDFSGRYVPGAFVIACLLTAITFALALSVAGRSVAATVGYWGDGVWTLLEFGMQMALIMVTGSILADSPHLRRGLDALAAVAASLLLLAWALYPSRREDVFTLSAEQLQALEDESPPEPFSPPSRFIAWAEDSWALCAFLGGLGLAWLARDCALHGMALTLNKLNLAFFSAALLLHPSPRSFARSAEKAAGYVHGVIVQFPLYAGMYGIIKGSGLDQAIGAWFVSCATPATFPLVVYWYSGVLNYFIPSGGSKFAGI
ncbi:MAG: short-chain fatty acid transporter [Elusimicrobia bacterium]|nr:short-chain fatty acid transporter [Elusimicrobiota bacterium]